jgi:hypothetical protein
MVPGIAMVFQTATFLPRGFHLDLISQKKSPLATKEMGKLSTYLEKGNGITKIEFH